MAGETRKRREGDWAAVGKRWGGGDARLTEGRGKGKREREESIGGNRSAKGKKSNRFGLVWFGLV